MQTENRNQLESINNCYDSVTEMLGKSNNIQSQELIKLLKDQSLYDAVDKECKDRGVDTFRFIKRVLFKNDKGFDSAPMSLCEYFELAVHYGFKMCPEDLFLNK